MIAFITLNINHNYLNKDVHHYFEFLIKIKSFICLTMKDFYFYHESKCQN